MKIEIDEMDFNFLRRKLFSAEIIDNTLLSFQNGIYAGSAFDYVVPTAETFQYYINFIKTKLLKDPYNKVITIEVKGEIITITANQKQFYLQRQGKIELLPVYRIPDAFDILKYDELFENPIGKILSLQRKSDEAVVQLVLDKDDVKIRSVSSGYVYAVRWNEIGDDIQELLRDGYKFINTEKAIPTSRDFWFNVFEAVTRD